MEVTWINKKKSPAISGRTFLSKDKFNVMITKSYSIVFPDITDHSFLFIYKYFLHNLMFAVEEYHGIDTV